MNEVISREQLLDSFKKLEGKFDESLADAKELEKKFDILRGQFNQNITHHAQMTKNGLSEANPLTPQISAFVELLLKTNQEWDARVAGREKGVLFRKGFEDSLLVFVNGKVKSGKSSLGNYFAWGNTEPDEELKLRTPEKLQPRYFTKESSGVTGGDGGDAQNEAEVRREFRVDETEATSSIQGFKLPGLTWVDSPGLHSVRRENEALAREYVDHADLILYTTKSDSPGRESDLAEIRALVGKGKRIIILVTGSDDVEEDWDDDTQSVKKVIVMKDDERRKRQRDYVRAALEKSCSLEELNSVQIVSFSARYAQLNCHDQRSFEVSGMANLCHALYELAHSDGVSIKRKVPLKNLQAFLIGCHKDIGPLEVLIPDLERSFDSLKSKVEISVNNHIRLGQSELSDYISNFFNGLDSSCEDSIEKERLIDQFQNRLNEKYLKVAEKNIDKVFNEILIGFQQSITCTFKSSPIIKLPGFKLEKIEEQVEVPRSGTKKWFSAAGSLFGGIVGFIFAGPGGAAVGSSIGGIAGNMSGRSAGVTYETNTIVAGNNLVEIQQKAISSTRKAFDTQMNASIGLLLTTMDQEVGSLLKQLNGEISVFQKGIQTLIKNTQRGL